MTSAKWKLVAKEPPPEQTEVLVCYVMDWGDGHVTKYGPYVARLVDGEWVASWDDASVLDYQTDWGSFYKTIDPKPNYWAPMPALPLDDAP